MRNSSLLKWAQNNKLSNKNNTINKQWLHPPDALRGGHIAYLVKFLGCTEVGQAKGIDVVKEGIHRLKFSQQLKKSEGAKIPKVELTVSIDGVAIQEPKTKRIMYQYALHRISYCADDKGEKKFFSFIAKEVDSEKHMCFVFVSDKLAEEITLTIGQAFDLAYRRFLETSGQELEMRKQLMILQKKVQVLDHENTELKKRLHDVSEIKDTTDVEEYMRKNEIEDLLVVEDNEVSLNGEDQTESTNTETTTAPPPVPPRSFEKHETSGIEELISLEMEMPAPAVGTKLQGLAMDDLEDEDFNPRSDEGSSSNGLLISEPPAVPPRVPSQTSMNGHNSTHKDMFGVEPFSPEMEKSKNDNDLFGMSTFNAEQPTSHDLESAIGMIDKKIAEMKDGFSRGIAFGNEDFSLESLDPLNNKN